MNDAKIPMETQIEYQFRDVVRLIWEKKGWITAGITVFTLIGLAYAFLSPEVYYSEAIIGPKKQTGGNSSSLLSQIGGGIGNLVANQLTGGNIGLDRMEIGLRSFELAESILVKYDLPASLFPAVIPGKKPSAANLKVNADFLRSTILSVKTDPRKELVRVGAFARDSSTAARIVEIYLKEYNDKVSIDARTESDSNRRFLESQLNNTNDPLLREKLQNMIGNEIEKAMLVSYKAFDVLETPLIPNTRERPKRKLILISSFLLGLFVSTLATIWFQVSFASRKRVVAARMG